MRKIKKLILISISLYTAYCILYTPAQALTMSSDSYEIQMGNLNMGAGRKDSENYALTDTMGQIAPGQYGETGFIVLAGFQYISSIIPFTFTISDLSIDFGSLTVDYFNEQTNSLTISNGSARGYEVTVLANKQLTSQSANTIPKTTCGDPVCTISNAQPWTSTDYYGFGFNVDGDEKASDFTDSTYFRPFPDENSGDSDQKVMEGTVVGTNKQVDITYRINISALQAAGDYENFLTFTAAPKI